MMKCLLANRIVAVPQCVKSCRYRSRASVNVYDAVNVMGFFLRTTSFRIYRKKKKIMSEKQKHPLRTSTVDGNEIIG